MKRTPLKRKVWMKRSTKPLPKINLARAQRQREKRSTERRSVEARSLRDRAMERAGGQCEYLTDAHHETNGIRIRCVITTDLEMHHLRYTKVRANSSLGDVQILCRTHHEAIEAARYSYRVAKRLRMRSMEAGQS